MNQAAHRVPLGGFIYQECIENSTRYVLGQQMKVQP